MTCMLTFVNRAKYFALWIADDIKERLFFFPLLLAIVIELFFIWKLERVWALTIPEGIIFGIICCLMYYWWIDSHVAQNTVCTAALRHFPSVTLYNFLQDIRKFVYSRDQMGVCFDAQVSVFLFLLFGLLLYKRNTNLLLCVKEEIYMYIDNNFCWW